MSKKNQQRESDLLGKTHDFINESVLDEKREKRLTFRNVVINAACGIIFGLCACVTFVVARPHVEEKLDDRNGSYTRAEETTEAIVVDNSVSEISINLDEEVKNALSEYGIDGTYDKQQGDAIEHLVTQTGKYMATVIAAGEEQWFDDGENKRQVTSGLIVETGKDQILILVDDSYVKEYDNYIVYFYNKKGYKAELYSRSDVVGLALLKVDGSILKDETLSELGSLDMKAIMDQYHLPAVAESMDSKLGEQVIFIGNPYGTGKYISFGNVTSNTNCLNRTDVEYEIVTTDISDKTISDGFLFDMEGNFVGMRTSKCVDESMHGIVYGINAHYISHFANRLQERKKFAYMGLICETVTDEIRENVDNEMPYGLYITGTEEGSPAYVATLMPGDILVRVGDNPVQTLSDYMSVLSTYEKDQDVKLTVMRKGREGYKEIEYIVHMKMK